MEGRRVSLSELDADKEEQWLIEKAAFAEYVKRRDAFAAEERAAANAAVQRALSSYRWWGWTNIVNTVRLAIQAWRLRRNAKAD